MDIQHLVKMANDIAAFFESQPDKAKAAKGVADHIKNFWDPRMRREILAYDQQGGAGLKELAREAFRAHGGELGAGKA